MPRLLKMEQHMIKMRMSQQKVLRTIHLPAVLLEAHLENFQILTMERQQTQMPHPVMIMLVLGLCFLATFKGSEEPAWGIFDTNDDVDSVWGFNAVSTTKDMDQESNKDHYFSGPGEFGLNPIRTGSSQGETRTHLGLQGLSECHWRLRGKTLIIGVHFSQLVALLRFCVCYSRFQAFLS
ncbi:uncharacterized protein LOC103962442 [Pyrus x bretschneideri]|uniref:uncharacterized protein LOC103962442 n=1 Tax=Pyrus x bretschneideri TaxID=225117 RepID=UPI0020306593|nr:uncharacterized protein LOC103962442 [Pyrus x bretschneideri]XP_048421690.1 uncharacterized protein LOC103962442 [Pyrus x bretschneideri]XP_048421697.1 uncharacterized protein LOC103962442 [Pyrus x bretschneideri]XP_048421701.1 uncharacterized protein LOC103962442 [Pyrus x bretschneideri]XP_048421704.1 uncharacterized protein LOC103962442 [Pyrus x bretschneideri]